MDEHPEVINKEKIINKINKKPHILKYISPELNENEQFMEECIEKNIISLAYLIPLRTNYEYFIKKINELSPKDFKSIFFIIKKEKFFNDTNLMKELIFFNTYIFYHIPQYFKLNINFVLDIIEKFNRDIFNIHILCKLLPNKIKKNFKIVSKIISISINSSIIKHFNFVHFNKEQIIKLLYINSKILDYLPKKYKNDYNLVLFAFKNQYKYTDVPLKLNKYPLYKNNINIILASISHNAYEYFSLDDSLKKNHKILKYALQRSPNIIELVEDNLKTDEIIHFVLRRGYPLSKILEQKNILEYNQFSIKSFFIISISNFKLLYQYKYSYINKSLVKDEINFLINFYNNNYKNDKNISEKMKIIMDLNNNNQIKKMNF